MENQEEGDGRPIPWKGQAERAASVRAEAPGIAAESQRSGDWSGEPDPKGGARFKRRHRGKGVHDRQDRIKKRIPRCQTSGYLRTTTVTWNQTSIQNAGSGTRMARSSDAAVARRDRSFLFILFISFSVGTTGTGRAYSLHTAGCFPRRYIYPGKHSSREKVAGPERAE